MKKNKEDKAPVQSVIVRNGKWMTSDGMCFSTAAKARQHADEIAPDTTPNNEPSSEQLRIDN